MDLHVTANGRLSFAGKTVRCALGRGGVRQAKREGDGASPVGRWPLRYVLYRADKMAAPETSLPVKALNPTDGWCDDPTDAAYNRPVTLPYPASAEHLWRRDSAYDIIAVLGYNDDPICAGKGSAIFFHIATSEYAPTAGCVAVAQADMIDILEKCGPGTYLVIENGAP